MTIYTNTWSRALATMNFIHNLFSVHGYLIVFRRFRLLIWFLHARHLPYIHKHICYSHGKWTVWVQKSCTKQLRFFIRSFRNGSKNEINARKIYDNKKRERESKSERAGRECHWNIESDMYGLPVHVYVEWYLSDINKISTVRHCWIRNHVQKNTIIVMDVEFLLFASNAEPCEHVQNINITLV